MKKLLPIGLALIAVNTYAERDWRGEGDLAFSKASGNSQSESLLANLSIVYERDRWTHTGRIEAVNTSEDDERSAEAYVLTGKSDFSLNETYYVFGKGRYEDNRFSGYEYQASATTGLGMHVIDSEVAKFDLEAGVGYRRSEEQGTGNTLNEAVVTLGGIYTRQITETTRFDGRLQTESGKDNTYAESELAVRVKINSHLAMKVAYLVKHNTDVPDGTKNTDTLTSVGLTYSF